MPYTKKLYSALVNAPNKPKYWRRRFEGVYFPSMILNHLARRGELAIPDLAKELKLHKRTVLRWVREFEKRKIVDLKSHYCDNSQRQKTFARINPNWLDYAYSDEYQEFLTLLRA